MKKVNFLGVEKKVVDFCNKNSFEKSLKFEKSFWKKVLIFFEKNNEKKMKNENMRKKSPGQRESGDQIFREMFDFFRLGGIEK